MIGFSNAKINIGLFVMNKRPDGFHALESVFWPIAWADALELHRTDAPGLELKVTGLEIPGTNEDNLICKAYDLMASKYAIGGVKAHLHKTIPMGAGLGGGSSNAKGSTKFTRGRPNRDGGSATGTRTSHSLSLSLITSRKLATRIRQDRRPIPLTPLRVGIGP